MPEIPKLQVITNKLEVANRKNLEEVIERSSLLKPQVKLLQILYLDEDIKQLNKHGLNLIDISLNDIYLDENYNIYAPIKDKIIPLKDNKNIKLKTYLIYLSYLYNIDLYKIFKTNLIDFYKIIFNLNINDEIKQNLCLLLNGIDACYFSDIIDVLNNSDFREKLYEDIPKLKRGLQKM